jgi:hypothetical protein
MRFVKSVAMKLLPFLALLLALTALAACSPATQVSEASPLTKTSTLTPATPTLAPATKTPLPPTETETATATATETATVKLSPTDFITDVAKLSEAVVVPDGQEAEYAQKILAMYKSGEIKNFSDQVVPASLNPGKIYKSVGFGTAYEIVGDLSFYKDVSLRSFRGVTLFGDGHGGVRMPILWLQPDRTVGLIWFHVPQKQLTYTSVKGGSVLSLFDTAFNKDPKHYILANAFNNTQSCTEIVGDPDYCAEYMSGASVSARDAAIGSFTSSDPTKNGFVTEEMTSGKIQFSPAGGTN